MITTMSYEKDVVHAIALIIGNERAMGETVHIAGAKPITWTQVNSIYETVLVEKFGYTPEMFFIDSWNDIGKPLNKHYQLKYARSISRIFDNSKLEGIIGKINFTSPEEGLPLCLTNFLDGKNKFRKISGKVEGYYNRITGDKNITFRGMDRIKYCLAKYTPYLDWKKMSVILFRIFISSLY